MWPECGHKNGLWDNFLFKNRIIPQTTFVPTFWPHIISELGGVHSTKMGADEFSENTPNTPKFMSAQPQKFGI